MNGFLAELNFFKEMYLPKYERHVEGLIYGKTIKKAIGGGEFWVTMETVVNLLILSEVGTQNDLNVRSNIMIKRSDTHGLVSVCRHRVVYKASAML